MAVFHSFPENHRRRGRFEERLADGTRVTLEVSERRRPLRGRELVNASISMRTGRAVESHVTEPMVALMIGNRGRMEIEALQNGSYRHGRWIERSLRKLAEKVTEHFNPQVEANDEDEPSPSGFTR